MDSSNIYQKNRISFLNSQRKNNYEKTKIKIYNNIDNIFIITGVTIIYVGMYIFFYFTKG